MLKETTIIALLQVTFNPNIMVAKIDLKLLCTVFLRQGAEHYQKLVGSSNRLTSDYFPYIQIDNNRLAAIIEDMSLRISFSQAKFLDIGCGYPVIPRIMRTLLTKQADGLEYNSDYINKINPYLFEEVRPIHADLLTFENYKEYDLLYSYVPIQNGKIMLEGIKYIQSQMKVGAIFYFIDAGILTHNEKKELGFELDNKWHYWVYVKPKTKKK